MRLLTWDLEPDCKHSGFNSCSLLLLVSSSCISILFKPVSRVKDQNPSLSGCSCLLRTSGRVISYRLPTTMVGPKWMYCIWNTEKEALSALCQFDSFAQAKFYSLAWKALYGKKAEATKGRPAPQSWKHLMWHYGADSRSRRQDWGTNASGRRRSKVCLASLQQDGAWIKGKSVAGEIYFGREPWDRD